MVESGLVFDVADLVDRPGKERTVNATTDDISIEMDDATIFSTITVEARMQWVIEGILTHFTASADATLRCTRCLVEWSDRVEVGSSQLFGFEPDEDGYHIEPNLTIDLTGPVRDELGLALPTSPRCSPDCRGLCPVCGTDLNREPCDGHGDDAESPFAVLKDLFDS